MVRTLCLLLLCWMGLGSVKAEDSLPAWKIYTFPIRESIMPSVDRLSKKCLKEALERHSDAVLIQMNTYGGLAEVADSIRSRLLDFPLPVWVWIDNQAASAGALIALAADSIYMRPGASIGAASVVDQQGRPMPDKFQSFMRSTMRATAEAHGKVVDRVEAGDTLWRWHRDPQRAEQMVGTTAGDTTTLNVLTLTADEAVKSHFCEGQASSVEEVLTRAGITNYTIDAYQPTLLDRLLGWLTHPVVQGVFVMLIIGGIYFEMQSPGLGFPSLVAIVGALLYFSPLFLEGMVAYWEILLFVLGVLLIGVEIFVLPGFGVAGILGSVAALTGLAFAAMDPAVLPHIHSGELSMAMLIRPFAVVAFGTTAAFFGILYFGSRFLAGRSRWRDRVVLTTDLSAESQVAISPATLSHLIGAQGVVTAMLRPSGKICIDGIYYDAVAENGFLIDKGSRVEVVRLENSQLYCRALRKTDE